MWLTIVCFLIASPLTQPQAADDTTASARASLARIQALRKERPTDGVLTFYEAVVQISIGERKPAFDLLRSLKGRKLGLIPVRDIGFDTVWDDAEFEAIRKELTDEEPRTPIASIAFRLADPKLIPEALLFAWTWHTPPPWGRRRLGLFAMPSGHRPRRAEAHSANRDEDVGRA